MIDHKIEVMMKAKTLAKFTGYVLSCCLLMTSCGRSQNEVWEDTKTAGHYMGQGVRSLAGKRGSSRQVNNEAEFLGSRIHTDEFIPLEDEDLYRQLNMGDMSALEGNARQAREAPGDPGSTIPGIDGFASAEDDPTLRHIFRRIHFPYDSDLIKGRDNVEILNGIAKYLSDNPNAYVFVEGHCDERGSAAYNLSLGSRRSNSVRNLLIKHGVDLDRLFTISYGKERPIVAGNDETSWSQNRRAQFRVYKKARG